MGLCRWQLLLKRPFEVFNGDYGNSGAAQTSARRLKRQHNDKKGAQEQLRRRAGRMIDSSVPGSQALQQGVGAVQKQTGQVYALAIHQSVHRSVQSG